ncbi:MAG: hypothetical protein KC466_01970 [Myxococcales bacterium]|nr:hypothetical protein [Myxococcales bacterium]
MAKSTKGSKSAEESRGLAGILEGTVPEMIKKAVYLGVGTAFMTEEGVRKVLGEMNISRDAIQYIVSQSDRTKEQIFGVVQTEIRNFLDRLDVPTSMKEILDGMSVELTTTITFKDGPKPKTRVAMVRRLKSKKGSGGKG